MQNPPSSQSPYPFNLFTNKSNRPPKKEYFDANIIRGIKRLFRSIHKNKIPCKTCIKIEISKPLQAKIFDKASELFRANQDLMVEISNPKNGPVILGNYTRPQDLNQGRPKSFNSTFCREFFQHQAVQKGYFLVLDLFMNDPDPNELCKRFNFFCCMDGDHTIDCNVKWGRLNEYLVEDYLRGMEIEVFERVAEEKIDCVLEGEI